MREVRINKITTGYQITIPANYRKQNNLKIGDYITFAEVGDKLIVQPIKKQKSNAAKMFNELFKTEIKSTAFDKSSEKKVMKIVNDEIKNSRKSKKTPKAAPKVTVQKKHAKKKKNRY